MKKRYTILALGMTLALFMNGCGAMNKVDNSIQSMDGLSGGGGSNWLGGIFKSEATNDAYVISGGMDGYIGEDEFLFGQPESEFDTSEYTSIEESGFQKVSLSPLSTFGADVDTGSYCNLRRIAYTSPTELENIADSIRTEELINYFDYKCESKNGEIFTAKTEINPCPWNEDNGLLVMTFQANTEMNVPDKGSNFVFLIDTSGSMNNDLKLPMVVESFKMLASTIDEDDRISIVTYSGTSDTLLEGSNDVNEINAVLDSLEAGGGTNGSGGIEAAYAQARANFIKGGNNRVIIASDGDMNLGVTTQSGLVDLIEEQRDKENIFLTVLGYGYGNYSDTNMESIANKGNGNYHYIDSIDEAKRVLLDKLAQTTITVAKDVKFQVEFNPAVVSEYRQIGYENRQMSASDFEDDTKDGGEVGAGQQVTVAYEIKYANDSEPNGGLKYQQSVLTEQSESNEICTVFVRYKDPEAKNSVEKEFPVIGITEEVSDDFNFVASVIELSMLVRDSKFIGSATFNSAYDLAKSGATDEYKDKFCEMIRLIEAAKK